MMNNLTSKLGIVTQLSKPGALPNAYVVIFARSRQNLIHERTLVPNEPFYQSIIERFFFQKEYEVYSVSALPQIDLEDGFSMKHQTQVHECLLNFHLSIRVSRPETLAMAFQHDPISLIMRETETLFKSAFLRAPWERFRNDFPGLEAELMAFNESSGQEGPLTKLIRYGEWFGVQIIGLRFERSLTEQELLEDESKLFWKQRVEVVGHQHDSERAIRERERESAAQDEAAQLAREQELRLQKNQQDSIYQEAQYRLNFEHEKSQAAREAEIKRLEHLNETESFRQNFEKDALKLGNEQTIKDLEIRRHRLRQEEELEYFRIKDQFEYGRKVQELRLLMQKNLVESTGKALERIAENVRSGEDLLKASMALQQSMALIQHAQSVAIQMTDMPASTSIEMRSPDRIEGERSLQKEIEAILSWSKNLCCEEELRKEIGECLLTRLIEKANPKMIGVTTDAVIRLQEIVSKHRRKFTMEEFEYIQNAIKVECASFGEDNQGEGELK